MHLKAAVVATAAVVVVMVLETTATSAVLGKTTPSRVVPRHQKDRTSTTSKGGQGKNKVIDSFIAELPRITSTVRNVTKGASEKQIENLKQVSKFLAPVMHMFFQLQAGPKGLTHEDRAMLDEVGTLTEYLTSTVLTKPSSQSPKDNTGNLLPDYTDLLEGPTILPTFTDIDTNIDLSLSVNKPQGDSLLVKTPESFDSSPYYEKQTPISNVSPSIKTIASRPAQVSFSALRVKDSPQVTRPRQATPITTWGTNYHGRTFAEEAGNKRDRSTEGPTRQPSGQTFRSFTSRRRYSPSRLLRQQLFGDFQSTSSSTTDASVNKHIVIPLTGSRPSRRAVLRRRRLTSTLP